MKISATIAGIPVGDDSPVRIMGIINLSPESFFGGSIYSEKEEIVAHAQEMVTQGCDFLDIGGRSTAPGVSPISLKTEKDRVLPVLKILRKEIEIPISIDTQYAEVGREALRLEADLINDVSGLRTDPGLIGVIKEYDCPLVLMATNSVPGDRRTVGEIIDALRESIYYASTNGVGPEKLMVDPGIGRWVIDKTYEYNLQIINQINALRQFGRPILLGISRKSFIGDILQKPDPAERLFGTLAATSIAVYNGAHIIRTHDVVATRDAIKIAELLKKDHEHYE